MKALVYAGYKSVHIDNVADPKIEKNDDIIVKITSTAICGSDFHLIHRRVRNLPHGFVLGHEAMGIVEETGKAVTKVKKGDRIIVPFPVSCGHCLRFSSHLTIPAS
jgi:S-(hydroxymethyl)glutathione dehydrogenase / alcohol dehydrogenase